MRVAGVIPCSFVNGEGSRYVVFLQGCPHHCAGCQNPETWDFAGGREISAAEIAADFEKRRLLDGITLSGGEPFCQQEACMELLDLLSAKSTPLSAKNVWIYTGYEYEDVADTPLAKRADVLVVGRFVESLKCEGKMYGSSNQRIIRKEARL